jgi:hypothetical protein
MGKFHQKIPILKVAGIEFNNAMFFLCAHMEQIVDHTLYNPADYRISTHENLPRSTELSHRQF